MEEEPAEEWGWPQLQCVAPCLVEIPVGDGDADRYPQVLQVRVEAVLVRNGRPKAAKFLSAERTEDDTATAAPRRSIKAGGWAVGQGDELNHFAFIHRKAQSMRV